MINTLLTLPLWILALLGIVAFFLVLKILKKTIMMAVTIAIIVILIGLALRFLA